MRRRLSLRSRERLPVEAAKAGVELRDLDRLVNGDATENLGCVAGRPLDLELGDLGGIGQTDGLLQRICAEAASGGNVAIDRTGDFCFGHDLDSRAKAERLLFLPASLIVSQWFPRDGF